MRDSLSCGGEGSARVRQAGYVRSGFYDRVLDLGLCIIQLIACGIGRDASARRNSECPVPCIAPCEAAVDRHQFNRRPRNTRAGLIDRWLRGDLRARSAAALRAIVDRCIERGTLHGFRERKSASRWDQRAAGHGLARLGGYARAARRRYAGARRGVATRNRDTRRLRGRAGRIARRRIDVVAAAQSVIQALECRIQGLLCGLARLDEISACIDALTVTASRRSG